MLKYRPNINSIKSIRLAYQMSTMKKRIPMFLLALAMMVAMALPTFAASPPYSARVWIYNCENSIDESNFSVQRQGCRIHLTTTEYQLFITLLDHSGHICSRNFLLASAWNITVPIQTRTVDVHIAKLRKKLNLGPDDLKTVMGRGYALSMHESCRANRSL